MVQPPVFDGFDRLWRGFRRPVWLVEGWALNLRNAYAHGHPPNLDHTIAYSILFHVVCVLRLIENP